MTNNAPTTPYRLLIVDDDKAILEEFRRAFSAAESADSAAIDALEAELFGAADGAAGPPPPSFELTTCSQGAAAVAAVEQAQAERRPFAAAFLDIRMPPGIDGVAAAKKIRQLDPQLPIVFITGFSDRRPEELQQQIPPPDKLDYVRKPFRVTDFVRLATELCQS